jgi:hypothetical protein
MARHPRFYEMLWKSVAPAIYGTVLPSARASRSNSIHELTRWLT